MLGIVKPFLRDLNPINVRIYPTQSEIIADHQFQEMGLQKFIEKTIDLLNKNLNLKDLDHHESLAFLKKAHNVNPSDIAAAIIALMAVLVIFLEGFRLVIIIGCYIFPIGKLILEFSTLQKEDLSDKKQVQTQKKSREEKQMDAHLQKRRKASLKEGMLSFQKADQEMEQTVESEVVSQKDESYSLLSENGPPEVQVRSKRSKEWEICKVIAVFMMINIALDILQPVIFALIALVSHSVVDFLSIVIEVIREQNWLALFRIVGIIPNAFMQLAKGELSTYNAVMVTLRVMFTAELLSPSFREIMLKNISTIFLFDRVYHKPPVNKKED